MNKILCTFVVGTMMITGCDNLTYPKLTPTATKTVATKTAATKTVATNPVATKTVPTYPELNPVTTTTQPNETKQESSVYLLCSIIGGLAVGLLFFAWWKRGHSKDKSQVSPPVTSYQGFNTHSGNVTPPKAPVLKIQKLEAPPRDSREIGLKLFCNN